MLLRANRIGRVADCRISLVDHVNRLGELCAIVVVAVTAPEHSRAAGGLGGRMRPLDLSFTHRCVSIFNVMTAVLRKY